MVRRDELRKRFGEGSKGGTATLTAHPCQKNTGEKRMEKKDFNLLRTRRSSFLFSPVIS
jgi:hypothetical protein